MRLYVTVVLTAIVLCAGGCDSLQSGTGFGLKSSQAKCPQSQEMTYADPIKMKIERCYWSSSISPMDDYDQAYQLPPSVPKPTKTAEDSYLVVELAMTNYGNSPLKPHSPPLFELDSADGKSYQAVGQMMDMTQKSMLGGNINPGHALKAREVFDVPKGQYDLKVTVSVYQRFGMPEEGGVAWVWELAPNESK